MPWGEAACCISTEFGEELYSTELPNNTDMSPCGKLSSHVSSNTFTRSTVKPVIPKDHLVVCTKPLTFVSTDGAPLGPSFIVKIISVQLVFCAQIPDRHGSRWYSRLATEVCRHRLPTLNRRKSYRKAPWLLGGRW